MRTVINKFKEVIKQVNEIVISFPPERRGDVLFDQWNLKDIIAHLSNWMVHDIDCMNALIECREPFWEPSVDDFNNRGIIARKGKGWDEIYEEFIKLSDELVRIYEALPSGLWSKLIWQGKDETATKFLEEDIAHWEEEHLGDLKNKLKIITQSWVTPKAQVRLSKTGGKGLFALSQIRSGEKVVVWKGDYVNRNEAEAAIAQGKLVMQWDEDLFSIEDRGDDIGYFINHCCDSNLWMQDAHTLVAKGDIQPDEEITADYALWEADENYVSKWECNCGSKICRKRITGQDWRLSELQKRYKGHFSPLINKRIGNLQ